MPITASAKKAVRQNARRKQRNEKQKDLVKKTVKQYRKLVAGKNIEEAKKQLPAAYRILDKAAKGGYIKKNKASRLKSRLTQLMSKSTKASS